VTLKRSFAVFFLSLAVSSFFGQDFHFSGFMQNMVYVNPAYAALPSSGEAGLTYRNQWPGISATFVTYCASLVVPVRSLNSGIGVNVMNDVQGGGVINQSSISLLYGYIFDVSNAWQVSAGIGASYVFKNFNADDLVFRSDILNDLGYSYGPVTLDNYNKSYPDFSVGLIAKNSSNLSFGVSVAHMTRPHNTFSEADGGRLPVKYTAFASGRLPVSNNSISIEPAIFYSIQHQNNELIWGSQFIIGNKFMLGGWIRQNMQFNFEDVIISAGISYQKYNISYHYDVNLKKISFLSTKLAAHEVTFLYRFEYKEEQKGKSTFGKKGRRGKKVACPAYN
jgi:type IX secretion system PorP/SprF family membrane protein